jgi:short-subunit dehydrogenase
MYTLITGASSGIGLELAKIFASNKNNLILVARSKSQLETLAHEIRENYKVQVQVVPMDLSLPESPKKLFDLTQTQNWVVDKLVNNAGFGDHGPFDQSDLQRQRDMIQVNITSLTELTHFYIQSMISRKSGEILNVASTAAFQPGPFMSVYYATKAYVLHFSEALHSEYKELGIHVSALCPGPTISGFQQAAKMDTAALFSILKPPTSKEVAEFGYRALKKNKAVAVHGFINFFLSKMIGLTPRTLVLKSVRKLQDSRRQYPKSLSK